MPKYAKPTSGPTPRRFSHFMPLVSNSVDNMPSGSFSGRESGSGSEDETGLLSRPNRSSISSAGPTFGMSSRIRRAECEATDDEDHISIPSAK